MFEKRYYQDEALFAIFDYFLSGKTGNPVVAMPTGTGKSIVIANLIKTTLQTWPGQRIIMLTHVKELIEQNANVLKLIWPLAPLGIYSAGLNLRNACLPIIFGGIQSVVNQIKKRNIFEHRDLLLIDEAHLLSPKEDTSYQYTIHKLKEKNPNLKVIGFTATPYRLKLGMITDNGIFTDICYDITKYASFNRLIAEGYICPLIPKKTNTEIDMTGISIIGGDYNLKQMEERVDRSDITFSAVKEIIKEGHNRKSWLIFAAGIANSEHIADMFKHLGIIAAASHSKLSNETNGKIIKDFKSGKLRALVNNNKFTTGFDYPQIDLIGMLRPTISPGLWVQMLGRGTRPAPGKQNCLVLDFAGNTKRLGPINDPVKPQAPGKVKGEAPVRICDVCGTYNHASAHECIECGHEFVFKNKLESSASFRELLKIDDPIIQYFDVDKILYTKHEKIIPSLKVSYFSGLRMFQEWIHFEHGGIAKKKAHDWWKLRHIKEPPKSIEEALQYKKELRVPKKIKVWTNKKYPEILNYEW